MPVTCKQINGKWRLVESDSGDVSMTDKGNPADGGGHATEAECKDQAAAVNANLDGRAAATVECECLDCGHKQETAGHCNEIKCEKCGGEMRRADRPGPGRAANEAQVRGYLFDDMCFRSYGIQPTSWDPESRSVRAVLATENPVVVMDMRSRRVIREVLRMDGYMPPRGNRLPLQDSHNRGSVRYTLGSSINLHIEGEGRDAVLAADNIISSVEDRVATKVKEGHITDNSIGYLVLDREIIEPGEEREVLGVSYRADALPLQVSTRWTPKENSLTPIGADEAATIRSRFFGSTEEKMAEEKKQEPPVETPPEPEKAAAPPAVEEKEAAPARRELLEEITPRGYEALLEDAVIRSLDLEAYRAILLAEKAKREAPVGTPEPQGGQKRDGLETIGDAEFLRAF